MKILAIPVLLLCLSGCVSVNGINNIRTLDDQRVTEKSYVLGEVQNVVVGNPIVRVREHNVRTLTPTHYTVSDTYGIRFNNRDYRLERGMQFPASGTRNIDGVPHTVVKFKHHLTYGFQVHPDGTVNKEVLYEHPNMEMWTVIKFELDQERPQLKMEPVPNVKYDTLAGDRNYEIIFNGNDGNALRFQYREYTSDNLARPAFYQDLSYINTSDYIRFRDLVIKLEAVRADELTFIVEAD